MFESTGDNRPIYTQLVERISIAILAGTYAPGERLPSVRDMASGFSVNPNTLQRALGELEQRGLIRTVSTSGKFVTGEGETIEGLRRELAGMELRKCRQRLAGLGYSPEQITGMMKEESDDTDTGM